MKKQFYNTLLLAILVVGVIGNLNAAIRYVKPGGSGTGDGSSWTNASGNLQAMINASSAGDQVWVAAGTYNPTTGTDRGISFAMKEGVGIYGGFVGGETSLGQRNWVANPTILSGDIGVVGNSSDNSYRIMYNANLSSSAVLDGVTLRDAYNPSSFNGNQGAGIRNVNASPTIRNCIIRNNYTGTNGGGVANDNSSPSFTNCIFIENYGFSGGGLRTEGGSPTITNCTFVGNTAYYGGAIAGNFGSTNHIVTNCIIWGNTGSGGYNSIWNNQSSSTTVNYSTVMDGYPGTGNLNVDPLFVNAAGGNLHLQACSPAINTATSSGAPSNDFDGNPRPVNTFFDMGAYEYQSALPPVTASCQNQTVYLNAAGNASIAATALNNGSTGCAPLTFTINGQPSMNFGCANKGANTVTLTVTNLHGTTATCNATVTVVDNIQPTISCPSNITVNVDPGTCNARVCYPSPVAADNCPPATPAGYTFQSQGGGSYYYLSNTTANYATASANARAAGGHLAVITSATENALIPSGIAWLGANDELVEGTWAWETCEPFTYTNWSPGEPNNSNGGEDGMISWGNKTWNDHRTDIAEKWLLEVEGARFVQTAGYGQNALFPKGTTTNTFVVTDASGNTNQCSFTVTVVDNTPPAISCPSNMTVNVDPGTCSANVVYPAPTVSDNCGINLLANPNGNSPVTTGWTVLSNHGTPPGFGQLPGTGFAATFYDCTDQSLINRKAQTIDLIGAGFTPAFLDASPPIAISESFRTGWLNTYGSCLGYTPPSFLDKYYLKVELRDAANVPIATINFGTESSPLLAPTNGITHSHTFTGYPAGVRYIYFEDGGGDVGYWSGFYGTYMENANVQIPLMVTQTGGLPSGSNFPKGTTINTFVVTDAAGNTSQCSFNVTVVDNIPPSVTCKPHTVTLGSNGQASITPADVYQSGSDNCGTVNLQSVSPNTFTCANLGNNQVTLTVNDGNGNTSTCTATVTVKRGPFTISTPNGVATVACPALAVAPTPPIVQSMCGENITPTGPVITNSPNPIVCEGTRVYTYTYTDGDGNTAQWSFTYTIEREPFTTPANGAATVACLSLAVPPIVPIVTDNCGQMLNPTGPVIVNNPNPISCEGTRTYTYTFTDCEGNSAQWSFVYTIEREPFTVPANGSTTVACPALATQPTPPTVQSNCGEVLTPTGPVIVNNPNPLTCEGTRTYTWTYTDCEGNSAQWSFTYTIERNPFTVPANGAATVACPALATQPTPPTVQSNCGEVLTPTGPVIVNNPNPLTCEGTRTYTWTYTDCEGNSAQWSFTYTIERNPFSVPANGTATVDCPDDTDVQPVAPVVLSNCGEVLTPVVTSSAKPGCEGNRNWYFTYTDCEGNTATWTFTYLVEYLDFNLPPNEFYEVECPIGIELPAPPVVYDNCGKLLNPTGPVITQEAGNAGCEASRQYAWTYKDCEGNAHTWTVTYHFQYNAEFFVYPDQVDYVACLDYAQPPIPPTVYDDCGQVISVTGPVVTEEISEPGCAGVRTFTFTYTNCGGYSQQWNFTYFAEDNEPPTGFCPSGTVASVDVTNLGCVEEVPCPQDYDFTAKIQELIAAGNFIDLCSGKNLVVTLDSWSELWDCSDPDGNGQFTFGRTFYFSIADQCGNEMPELCAVTYSGACQPITTFPASTWGLEDEMSNIDMATIQHLLDAHGPLTIGGSARSLTLTSAPCVADLLPGQGAPSRLGICHQVNCIGCNPAAPGGMKNQLAANAIALQLSLRYSVEFNGANMPGMMAQSLGCIQLDPAIVTCANGPCKLRVFDQQGMPHFFPYTLGGLVDLVNFYLGANVAFSDGLSGVYATALNAALVNITNNWGNQPLPGGCDPNPGATGNPMVDKANPKLNPGMGKGQLEEYDLVLFPNPSNGFLNVQWKDLGKGEAQLSVFDRLGRTILVQKLEEGSTQLQLDLRTNKIADGDYYVQIIWSRGVLTQKFVVTR